LNRAGKHFVRFANVDDQLLLWVDEKAVSFDSPTHYSSKELFGERGNLVPRTSESDPGDLAPIGIASRDATLVVDRLRVWRDVYYIATQDSVGGFDDEGGQDGGLIDYADFPADDLLSNPREWGAMALRRHKIFDIGKEQLFVLGDNSPASQDARLWHNPSVDQQTRRELSHPGGNYLERRLLIGRAVGVVWPHTWNFVIPGFSDMRLIR
jgi:signal peptidase I